MLISLLIALALVGLFFSVRAIYRGAHSVWFVTRMAQCFHSKANIYNRKS